MQKQEASLALEKLWVQKCRVQELSATIDALGRQQCQESSSGKENRDAGQGLLLGRLDRVHGKVQERAGEESWGQQLLPHR